MATSATRPARITRVDDSLKERELTTIEDTLDCMAVDRARAEAAQKGEKPVSWKEFKKKLDL